MGSAAPNLDQTRAVRDNDAWVRELAQDGPVGEAALRDLRVLLVNGLRRMLAARNVGDDLCEDFAHDALVRIRERLGTFRSESRFTTWALSIATRVAFDELRHKRWKDVSFEAIVSTDGLAPPPVDAGASGSQERALLRERVLSELRQVIQEKLTDKQRAILMAELSGMPHAEIAAALGSSRGAVYKLSHDARKRLKVHLEGAGIREDEVLWAFE